MPIQPTSSKIRVMIVEDSRTVREYLQEIVNADPCLEVVAAVDSGEKALRVLRYATPDVISLDLRLPGIDGYEVTRRVMAERPTPIVAVSATVTRDDQRAAIEALKAGAVSAVEKPVGRTHPEFANCARRLCYELVTMSQVRVIRQRFNRFHRTPGQGCQEPMERPAVTGVPRLPNGDYRMLGVVASTGGPNALERLFNSLPVDFPLPILVVQHITNCFHAGFIEWLEMVCPQPVVEAHHGQTPLPGVIYLAPADRHLRVGPLGLELDRGPEVSLQRPSGTVLFESMARHLGSQGLGVLLTGMGDDGAAGLLAMHDRGGYTIAEHESTAAVFGMPAVAISQGAADIVLPIDGIGDHLLQILTSAETCS